MRLGRGLAGEQVGDGRNPARIAHADRRSLREGCFHTPLDKCCTLLAEAEMNDRECSRKTVMNPRRAKEGTEFVRGSDRATGRRIDERDPALWVQGYEIDGDLIRRRAEDEPAEYRPGKIQSAERSFECVAGSGRGRWIEGVRRHAGLTREAEKLLQD